MTTSEVPVRPPAPGRSQFRVLLVDDDALVLTMNRMWLEQVGVRAVDTALNGREALDLLSTMPEPPDVIISDLNMPRMDGVELLRHVAERRVGAGVIISSGEEPRLLASVHQLALQHGLNVLGVMPKPLTYESLVKLLNDFSGISATSARPAIERITEEELDRGLREGALTLVYQPKVVRATGIVAGVEALARWNHPERGLLGPFTFVQLAEETGRIGELTRQVLARAIADCGKWNAEHLALPVSVNVAADDLEDVTLPDHAKELARAANIAPAHITLEVTESRIMKNLRATMEVLSRLRLNNFSLSIDDFGTGYASLEQLKRAPFTEVKVDRAFVSGASSDPTSLAILESSIALGRRLKMRVVAEGAETQEDWDLLERLDCEIVQGYLVARPMVESALRDWLTTWRSAHPPTA